MTADPNDPPEADRIANEFEASVLLPYMIEIAAIIEPGGAVARRLIDMPPAARSAIRSVIIPNASVDVVRLARWIAGIEGKLGGRP
jgi:hypothetical protein